MCLADCSLHVIKCDADESFKQLEIHWYMYSK